MNMFFLFGAIKYPLGQANDIFSPHISAIMCYACGILRLPLNINQHNAYSLAATHEHLLEMYGIISS